MVWIARDRPHGLVSTAQGGTKQRISRSSEDSRMKSRQKSIHDQCTMKRQMR